MSALDNDDQGVRSEPALGDHYDPLIGETEGLNDEDEPGVYEPDYGDTSGGTDDANETDGANDSVAQEELSSSKYHHVDPALFPSQILIGYQEGGSKKDLMRYLYGKVQLNMSPASAYYQVKKSGAGFYWEIHDGGSGQGVLSSLLEALTPGGHAYIKTSGKPVQVTLDENCVDIRSFSKPADFNLDPTPWVAFTDSLAPFLKRGTGSLIFGSALLAMGVVALLMSFAIKYLLVDSFLDARLDKVKAVSPYTQLQRVEDVLSLDGAYVTRIELNARTGGYVISTNNGTAGAESDSADIDNNESLGER